MFLELDHNILLNKIIIGNVYKPPRDNNSARNINAFKTERKPILQELGANNDEVVICGDYNINRLKMNGETHFSDFYTMLGHTRLNRSSGATLIDNIYCKLSSQTVTSSTGIILDELSDNYPYILRIDDLNTKLSKPPRRVKQNINDIRAMESLRDDIIDKT